MVSKKSLISFPMIILPVLGLLFFMKINQVKKSAPPSSVPITLHLALEGSFQNLDPIFAMDGYSAMQVSQSYEGLLQYHYLKRPYVLIPLLTTSMPEISSDQRTYRFHLKKAVFFQDDPCFQATAGKGRELTAEDVIYSFKRLVDPKLASPGGSILKSKIEGLNLWYQHALAQAETDYSQNIQGLQALDRYTLQIRLTQKSRQFLYYLAMPFTSIVPKEAVDFYGQNFQYHPVGTGPFRLSEKHPEDQIIWTKNPTFHSEFNPMQDSPREFFKNNNTPLPWIDQIIFHQFPNQQAAWSAFVQGKLDISPIPIEQFNEVITPTKELQPSLTQQGIRLYKSPHLNTSYLSFNLLDPILGQNKYLRQAMSLAYDQKTFLELFFNGRGIPAKDPIPPELNEYSLKIKNPYRKFNIVQAKELLVKAGFPHGRGLPVFQFAALEDHTGQQEAEYFKRMMQEINIKIITTTYSFEALQEALRQHQLQLWSLDWIADYPDPETFLQLFYSKNLELNDSHYFNTLYDHLYENWLQSTSFYTRKELYKKMISLLIEDCPWIFGVHRINYTLVQPWLFNYQPHAFDYRVFKYYQILPKTEDESVHF